MKRPLTHFIAGLLAAGVLLAGWGGSTSSSPSAQSGNSAKPFDQHFVAFAACMRSHGEPDYPDPQFTSSGGVRISPGHADPGSPAFKSANRACHQLLPNGGAPVGAATTQAKAQEVKFADCMRVHGVPNFPDPSHDGAFDLPAGLDSNAPRFAQAEHACNSVQPSSLSINANSS